jgi:phage tail sheath protein FI
MMTYSRPGVYINERLLPAPVAVNGTANAAGATFGAFAQGPETVTLVTSWYDFVKKFGGYDVSYPATFGVGQFFYNGGSELYVRRVLASDAAAASVAIPKAVSGTIGTITAKNKGADGNNLRVQITAGTAGSGYFDVTVYKETVAGTGSDITNDIVLEQFTNVVFNNSVSSDFAPTVIGYSSANITMTISDTANAPTAAVLPLTSGSNGTAAALADYTGVLSSFNAVDRPLVIFAPEAFSVLSTSDVDDLHNAMIAWADANNGFAVLDTAPNLTAAQAITYAGTLTKTANAAVYYPNLFVQDPLGRSSQSLRKSGPAAAVAGLYIQTDRQTGPFKAPAGIRAAIRSAVSLEKAFTNAELDSLNSAATPVNALRNLPGAGIVSMGARTLKQDGTANRYVNMRRSLIYIKKQLNDLTQFALFENNDEKLWARIRTGITVFLNDYRNAGGLRGATAADAFFIKVDAENNSAESIALGEVHIEIGVALEYPAEFVVINLSQKTSN